MQEQEKEVTVMNITEKTIHSNKTNKDYTIQQVQCNDGITYESFDGDYVKANFQLNAVVKMKYIVETRNANGQVYTTYKIASPKRSNPAFEEIKELIKQSEANILKAIQSMGGSNSVDVTGEINPND